MAIEQPNYQTRTSFIIPLTDKQAVIANIAIETLVGEVSNHLQPDMGGLYLSAESMNGGVPNLSEVMEQATRLLASFQQRLAAGQETNITPFNSTIDDSGLYIYPEQAMNIQQVVLITQEILKFFDSNDYVAFTAAQTTDDLQRNGYSGCGFFITRDNIQQFDLDTWISDRARQHHQKRLPDEAFCI